MTFEGEEESGEAISLERVVAALESIAPSRLAGDWDNVGLLAGDLRDPIERVMLCIDLMPAVVEEARRRDVSLVVAYHPPIFRPISRMVVPNADRMESGVFHCIRAGIALYTPHTAYDAAAGGTNDVLASLCGAVPTQPIEPDADDPRVGQGRFGSLEEPTSLATLVERVKGRTGASCVSAVGDPGSEVRRVIVLVGAAGSVPFAVEPGPGDCIVTGEIRHHDALRIRRVGASAIALSHWSSERPALTSLKDALTEAVSGLTVFLSEADAEPFWRA